MQSHEVKEKLTLEADTTKENVRTVHRTMKTNRDANIKYSATMQLDFEGCQRQDLIKIATESVVIKIQSRFRSAYPKGFVLTKEEAAKWERVWKVKEEIVNAERAKISPFARAVGALASMDEADRRAFLEAELAKLTQK
jgi:hypothetical protein